MVIGLLLSKRVWIPIHKPGVPGGGRWGGCYIFVATTSDLLAVLANLFFHPSVYSLKLASLRAYSNFKKLT